MRAMNEYEAQVIRVREIPVVPLHVEAAIRRDYPQVNRMVKIAVNQVTHKILDFSREPIPVGTPDIASMTAYTSTVISLDRVYLFTDNTERHVELYRVGIHGDTAYASRWYADPG